MILENCAGKGLAKGELVGERGRPIGVARSGAGTGAGAVLGKDS